MSLIESSAPGRFALVGNPSDMYGGTVISCTISERAVCTIDTDSDSLTISAGDESADLKSADDLTLSGSSLDIPKAVLAALQLDPSVSAPFSLIVDSQIPRQSGLAGSTALIAAVLGALLEHLDLTLHRYAIAEKVRAIEFDQLKTLCGFQDAYMTVFGGLQYMDFRGKSISDNNEFVSPYATVKALEHQFEDLYFLVAYSGIQHHSGRTHADMYARFVSGDADALSAASEFARYGRAGKLALLNKDWQRLAELMTSNQALIRRMQPQNPVNELLIDAALSAGALAAKLAGAGGGGSVVALTDNPERVAAALRAAGATAVLFPKLSPGLTVCRVI